MKILTKTMVFFFNLEIVIEKNFVKKKSQKKFEKNKFIAKKKDEILNLKSKIKFKDSEIEKLKVTISTHRNKDISIL